MLPMQYEVLVIGSGQGAGPLAQVFARSGKKTALIEPKHVGGTCINQGCTLTKTMVASGRSAYMECGANFKGIDFERSTLQLNLETARKRKGDIVDSFRGGSEMRIRDTKNLDLIMDKARFISSNEIEVASTDAQQIIRLTADKIFINAGCSPSPLTIQDSAIIEPAHLLTSTSIVELDTAPRHLPVVGGGHIGVSKFLSSFVALAAKSQLSSARST